jgi:hypothetical protein
MNSSLLYTDMRSIIAREGEDGCRRLIGLYLTFAIKQACQMFSNKRLRCILDFCPRS